MRSMARARSGVLGRGHSKDPHAASGRPAQSCISSTTAGRTPIAWPRRLPTTVRATSSACNTSSASIPARGAADVLDFMRTCEKPIVTTFHTLLTEPDEFARRLVQDLATHSQGIVVMTHVAARLLRTVYDVSDPCLRVIPHGVPEVPFERDELHKAETGVRRPPADLHVWTDQSRQGPGIHDSGDAADRGHLPRRPLPDRGRRLIRR